ncbi:cellulose biosynthesis protein CelD [Rhizobium sp. Root1203]|uniref:GNAT family N-acetyltransferase n=1 Tax=Rhizobium sp. Root1203 TaxID=1736427 RepID=UPI000708AA1F|nr:GNAT family N-acetyltransferase [Rhizobium sp. Root1203]KQV11345.1 cellulose biosynthesis protein CelD [Rhizobium sp. Root1203]
MQMQKLHVDGEPCGKAGHTDTDISPLKAPPTKLVANDFHIDIVDAMEPVEHEWRAFERDDLNSLHHGYDWCASWVRAYGNPLALIRGRSGNETVFILPVEIVQSRGARIAKFIGADHSNINTGLFSSDFAAASRVIDPLRFRDLLRAALGGRADLLLLQNIPLEWRGRDSPLAVLPLVRNQNHAYHLPILDTLDATLRQVNAKHRRKKFRVQSKRLESLGGFDYIAGGPEEEQHRLLDRFFQQKSERLKAMGLPDVFADAETRAFLHGAIGSRDVNTVAFGLEMHAIRLRGEHDGDFAAISGISRKGDHVICQFSAIDERVAPDASPGEFLFWQMIAGLHGKGVSLFDFGLGDQRYKRSWAPVETEHYDVVLPVTARGNVSGFAHRIITRSKAYVKSHQELYRFARRVRRVTGR